MIARLLVVCGLLGCGGATPPTERTTEAPIRKPPPVLARVVDATPDARPIDAVPAGPTPVEMAHVPATRFRMGSREGRPDERPVHGVAVDAFAIDLTEVTVAAYAECVAAKRCSLPDLQIPECDWNRAGLSQYPINCVNWDQAVAFCEFAGKRLPTEDEWELAARGTDGRALPYGNGANGGEECEFKSTDPPLCPVASAPSGRSAFGLYDMTGNVDEWTASSYCPYVHPACGDPRKTTRGGASDFIGGTATSRTALAPHTIGDALGFRCAQSE